MNIDEQDFDNLIGQYLNLWPNEIDVSQVYIEGQPSPYKELIASHDRVEQELEELDDDKLWVLDWSMFKYISALAKGEDKLLLSGIDLESVKSIYLVDISKWREEFG